jgi:hypothetical protein
MKFPSLLFHVPIHITMFEMPIRIPPFLVCGFYPLVSFLVDFFLSHVLLSFPGVQLNVENLLSFLIYAFHTMKLQLSLNIVENSSKVLHHHPWLFERDTQLDCLPPKVKSVLLHSFSLFLPKVFTLHDLFLFVAYGI